jgi:hypothetical protein
MGLFETHERFNSLTQFNTYLSDISEEISDLHVSIGLTQFSESEIIEIIESHDFHIEERGQVYQLHTSYMDDDEIIDAQFYFHYHADTQHDGGILLFYTNQRKTKEVDNTVMELLRNQRGVYYLHFSANLFRSIRESIDSDEDLAEITEFVADRTESSDRPCRIRPNTERTIQYYADDGWRTLEEMEQNYGVRPRYIVFKIPNVLKFKISRDGIFSYHEGDLQTLFNYIEVAITEALQVKEAFDTSEFEMVSATSELDVPTSTPAQITLNNNIEFSEIDEIKSRMAEADYYIINSFEQEGSVRMSSKVYDERRGEKFRLKATEDKVKVYPQTEEEDLGSFLRFHEFIQNNVDESAEVEA